MADRVCVRGCTRKGVHYATCGRSGAEWEGIAGACKGCAPRECREGSLICDGCFGRMRRLLDDAGDLLGRLRSIADPEKAIPTDQPHYGVASVEPVAPVGADLLDAIAVVEFVVASVAPDDLPAVANDLDEVLRWSALVLDRHADVDGLRVAWSVQDAVDRWGVERRDRSGVVWQPETDGVIASFDVHEHGDPLVSLQDAAVLVGESRFTVARWERKGLLKRAATIPGPRGSRKAMFRLSEVRAVWESDVKGKEA